MNWKTFLQDWDDQVIHVLKNVKDKSLFSMCEEESLKNNSLFFPGANGQQITDLENRLNTNLPGSYKEFLKTTNGWVQIAMDATSGKIWPTDNVDWLLNQDPEWIDSFGMEETDYSDEEYLQYGEHLNSLLTPSKYLESVLAISETVDCSIYLLNPKVTNSEGEWEAWWLSATLPGALRYQSFAELMTNEKIRILNNLSSMFSLD